MNFSLIKSAIRTAESVVVDHAPLRERDDPLRALMEETLVGPWLVMKGLTIIWKRIAWALVIAALFSAFLSIVYAESFGSTWLAAMAFGMGCVYFGLPSRTVLAGVSEQSIKKVSERIWLLVNDKEALDQLLAGVQLIKAQATERLGRLGVFVGVVWGALFWFVSTRVLSPDLSPELIGTSVSWALVLVVIFSFLLVTAISYAAAVRAVFLNLEFALIEIRGRLSAPGEPLRRSPSFSPEG